MDVLTPVTADMFFSSAENQSAQMDSLATQALTNGIDKYMNKDYKGAAAEFKRSIGLSPYSDYAVDATKYLAQSYLQMDETDKAVNAYRQSLQMMPQRDDLQISLGNLLVAEGRNGEAIDAFEQAVRIYDDATNRFSLGQSYLAAGRIDDAEAQFEKVIKMNPEGTSGYFGLGQVYGKQKKYPEAIEQFQRAISKNKEFYDGYAEMGFTYVDAGEMDKAKEIKDLLDYKDPGLADLLNSYTNKMTKPKILFAWTAGSFQSYLPKKTLVSDLGAYLKNANGSQMFAMEFQFNKAMDRESVENTLNWKIARSAGNGPGTDYNFGVAIPDTEVRINPYPISVYYNEKEFTATVRFNINQNANADGTIDPTHIEFAFKGLDADGNTMDPKFDQYMGYTGSI